MDDTDEALETISELLPRTGVTAFVPTTMTYDRPRVERILTRIKHSQGKIQGAHILGAHMEGPFINAEYKGAQDGKNIAAPDFSCVSEKIMTDILRNQYGYKGLILTDDMEMGAMSKHYTFSQMGVMDEGIGNFTAGNIINTGNSCSRNINLQSTLFLR